MKKKKIEIGGILERLREFRNDSRYGDRIYAIDENIKFAEAMKSLLRYAWWLLKKVPSPAHHLLDKCNIKCY